MKLQLSRANKIRKQNEFNKKLVVDFVFSFIKLNSREPTETEIIDNLKDKINIETIKKIIDENKSTTIKINMNESNNGFNLV